ncbi:MAG: HEPN domain-containing protein [Flexilinea sp.]
MTKNDWYGILEVAVLLYDKADTISNPEYSYRSSISRSYYASYHCIKQWEIKNKKYNKTGNIYKLSDHRDVVRALTPINKKMSDKLDNLLRWRETSDYFNSGTLKYSMIAERSISYAQDICDYFSKGLK